MEIQLRGLPEGIVGKPSINVQSVDDLFSAIPQLNDVKDRLVIEDDCISGFSACDG